MAQSLFDAELLQFRRGDFPIIQLSAGTVTFNRVGKAVQLCASAACNKDLQFASRLRSWRKIPIHRKAVQYRDAAPAHCRVRSELESAPPRSQVEWHMAFLLNINGTNRSVDVDGDTVLLWVARDVLGMTGTTFGCGSQTGSSDTIAINQVRRP